MRRRASTPSSPSSTGRLPLAPGSEAARTGSPTSHTCRGCSVRGTCSASTSSGSRTSRSGSGAAQNGPQARRRSRSLPPSDPPGLADAGSLAAHLGDDDLVVGDVRGPNAHSRGHIPGSRPLVLGSPPPGADEATASELAKEVALRLRRHGITGRERLVLVDRGDGVGAMPAAQMAELAGHPRVAILLGGIAGWDGELTEGPVELEPVRDATLVPNPRALPTRQELASRLDDPAL